MDAYYADIHGFTKGVPFGKKNGSRFTRIFSVKVGRIRILRIINFDC